MAQEWPFTSNVIFKNVLKSFQIALSQFLLFSHRLKFLLRNSSHSIIGGLRWLLRCLENRLILLGFNVKLSVFDKRADCLGLYVQSSEWFYIFDIRIFWRKWQDIQLILNTDNIFWGFNHPVYILKKNDPLTQLYGDFTKNTTYHVWKSFRKYLITSKSFSTVKWRFFFGSVRD